MSVCFLIGKTGQEKESSDPSGLASGLINEIKPMSLL